MAYSSHSHTHGNHTHTHAHDFVDNRSDPHEHGWHDAAEQPDDATDYDDSFGEEPLAERVPSGRAAAELAHGLEATEGLFALTPYVPGMLKAEVPYKPWVMVDVSHSQYDYWDLLVRALTCGRPFLLVEHDMAPTFEEVQAVLSCPEPVCTISYDSYWGDIVEFFGDMGAIGFIAYKNLVANERLAQCLFELGPVTWSKLDGYMYRSEVALSQPPHGLATRPHIHPGSVKHLHTYGDRPVDKPAANGCCHFNDYSHLHIRHPWKMWLVTELDWWHKDYLPVPQGGTVLDVGAGCGETVEFYLRHGAGHVIAVEGDPDAIPLLRQNFGDDPRVTIVAAHIDKVKVDIEGSEEAMDLETHFPFRWDTLRVQGGIVQQRLVRT
ncbi:MAG TPA: hypothetical protein VEJ84_05850 [Acidimicrobiales bacterium]|nr:hypothetical protein [Acidimicrobiales bacterium]